MLMVASALPADASTTLAQACAQQSEITFSAATVNEIQQFLEADSSNLVLVFMEFAAENLARVIHAGTEALATQAESWRRNAEALLDLHKLTPARLYLLSFQSARHAPEILHSFDLALSLPGLSARDCLSSLLASHWLNNQEALISLDQQLRDCNPSFSEAHLPSESALAAAQFSADQSAQLARYREENSLLLRQLHMTQVQLERHAQLQSESALTAVQLSAAQIAHYREENNLLLRQLHLAQEQLALSPQQTESRIISITPKKKRSGLENLLHSYRVSRHRSKFQRVERIVRPLLSRAYRLTKRLLRK